MKAILKQTFWLGIAQILTRGISFFYTIYLAQALGVSDFGLFIVALSYFSIISAVADFGFNRFLIREIAQDKLQTHELLWNVAILRLTLTTVLFAVFAFFLYIFDTDKVRVSLILLATLSILPQAIGMTFDGIFVALRKLQFCALALFLSSLSNALIGYYLINKGFGVAGAINALVLGQLFYAFVLFAMISFSQGLHFPQIKLSIFKKALIGSLPYGILGVLGLIYFRVDAIMLSYLRGDAEVGIYGAAYRFLEAVTVVPTIFFASLFPVFANFSISDHKQIKKLYFKSLELMLILGLVVLIGYLLILPEIIKIFLPSYLPSIVVIAIISLSIPFMFMQTSAVSLLLASEKYIKPVLVFSFLTLAFNILANLIFIPTFGFMAAAWVTVASEVLSFIIFFLFINLGVLSKESG